MNEVQSLRAEEKRVPLVAGRTRTRITPAGLPHFSLPRGRTNSRDRTSRLIGVASHAFTVLSKLPDVVRRLDRVGERLHELCRSVRVERKKGVRHQ